MAAGIDFAKDTGIWRKMEKERARTSNEEKYRVQREIENAQREQNRKRVGRMDAEMKTALSKMAEKNKERKHARWWNSTGWILGHLKGGKGAHKKLKALSGPQKKVLNKGGKEAVRIIARLKTQMYKDKMRERTQRKKAQKMRKKALAHKRRSKRREWISGPKRGNKFN